MTMVIVLTALAQTALVLVITQLPKLLRLKFYPSYAAMTFPFVVSALALSKVTVFFAGIGVNEVVIASLNGLVLVQTVFGAAMVVYVLARYLYFFFGPATSKQPQVALARQAKEAA